MSDKKISYLAKSLFDENIRIENVFILPFIYACDSMPDSFWDVFDENPTEFLESIGLNNANMSDYDDLLNKTDLLNFMHDRKISGFSIQFSTTVPTNFSFDDGKFYSCDFSWGLTYENFAYGQSIDKAINHAIKIKRDYFNECIEKAKYEC